MTATIKKPIRAPFPYFGGKSRVASIVWERFGDVPNYVEPFAGSLAVLLSRPHDPRIETVNDLDGMVANFWRAIAADPDAVAAYADWPVNELDLHARHSWLVNVGREQVEQLRSDPDYYDAKIAGWWVWGICQWIGGGWCSDGSHKKRPNLGNSGQGVHRLSHQIISLGDSGRGDERPGQNLQGYFADIANRLRRVRVFCGDWSRTCGPTPTFKQGLTGVFLDPPYDRGERDPDLYATESDAASDVRKWCHKNGRQKLMRIALCGYAGEGHESLEDDGWTVHEWKAAGGYGGQSDGKANDNARRERIWFSPHCLKSDRPGLFDDLSSAKSNSGAVS